MPGSRNLMNMRTQKTLIRDMAKPRPLLRLTHLAAHLKTLPILTDQQIALYSRLRGYGSWKSDACASVPTGHDPVMWRKHNGCQ